MKKRLLFTLLAGILFPFFTRAGEADLEVPDLESATFFGGFHEYHNGRNEVDNSFV